MVMLHPCIACQDGDHANHIPMPGPVPEGMIGGWACPCEGDCKPPPPPAFIKDMTDYAAFSDLWPKPAASG